MMIKKIFHLSTSLVCAGFLFGANSVYAAIDCPTVCQNDVCHLSPRIADVCVKECGTVPRSCKSAAKLAMSADRRKSQESKRDQVRAERQARKNAANQSSDDVNVGSLFDEPNQTPAENVDTVGQNPDQEMNNEATSVDTPSIESENPDSDQSTATNEAPTLDNPPVKESAKMDSDVCKTPQATEAAITKAIDILKSITSTDADKHPNQDATGDNSAPVPPPPPPVPNLKHHTAGKQGGQIDRNMLKEGHKKLRPVGERKNPNTAGKDNGIPVPPPPPPMPNSKQHLAGKEGGQITPNMLEEGRNKLRKTRPQDPRVKQLQEGRGKLRKTTPNERPKFEVNQDPMGKQLQAEIEKRKLAAELRAQAGNKNNDATVPPPPAPNFRGKPGNPLNPNMVRRDSKQQRPTGQRPNQNTADDNGAQTPAAKAATFNKNGGKLRPNPRLIRTAGNNKRQAQQNSGEIFHNSESGDSGLDKFGKMLTGQVMKKVSGQG